jgi:hypothetical protein
MPNIKNMTQLRNKVLQTLDDLENGDIDLQQASVIAKLSETVISGLKSEMQYAILTQQEPVIPFYGEKSGIALKDGTTKKLL